MHDWLLQNVILPTIKAICELCEMHGISFVCYIEHKDGMTWDSITHSVQGDATDTIKEVLRVSEGKSK